MTSDFYEYKINENRDEEKTPELLRSQFRVK